MFAPLKKELLYSKVNFRCIKDLNMKGKTTKLLEENLGKYLCSLWIKKDVLLATN